MVVEAGLEDLDAVVRLSLKLWPEHTYEEMAEEFEGYITESDSAVYIVKVGGDVVGFSQVGLRHDYVEGTESSPVGYLEGIYVEEAYRELGHASGLARACEQWSREMGCSEFASDIEMDNDVSYQFHIGYGFEEANRVICFTKRL